MKKQNQIFKQKVALILDSKSSHVNLQMCLIACYWSCSKGNFRIQLDTKSSKVFGVFSVEFA